MLMDQVNILVHFLSVYLSVALFLSPSALLLASTLGLSLSHFHLV